MYSEPHLVLNHISNLNTPKNPVFLIEEYQFRTPTFVKNSFELGGTIGENAIVNDEELNNNELVIFD